MNASSYYLIGDNHEYCQDYAVAKITDEDGKLNRNRFMIGIADGCSTGQDTDIGARMILSSLLLNTEKNALGFSFKEYYDSNRFGPINYNSLLSTYLYATSVYGVIRIDGYGDGGIYVKFKNGEEKLIVLDFPDNAPYYALYEAEGEQSTNSYLREFPRGLVIHEKNSNSPLVKETKGLLKMDSLTFSQGDVSFIGLTSDGLFSFSNIQTLEDKFSILKEVFAIPNYNGVFAVRALRSLKRKKKLANISHHDDLSIACIAL